MTNHVDSKDMKMHEFRAIDRTKWMAAHNIVIGTPRYEIIPYGAGDANNIKEKTTPKSAIEDNTHKLFSSKIPSDPWGNTLKYTKSIRSEKAIRLMAQLNSPECHSECDPRIYNSVDSLNSFNRKKFDISHNVNFADPTPTELDMAAKYSRNKLYYKSLVCEYSKAHCKSQMH